MVFVLLPPPDVLLFSKHNSLFLILYITSSILDITSLFVFSEYFSTGIVVIFTVFSSTLL